MDDSLHKQLADQMRRTFNGYQTPYQLGAWEAFERHRQPARRRGVIWFRYAAAACLLAGLALAPLWVDDAGLPAVITPVSSLNRIGPAPALTNQRTTGPLPAQTRSAQLTPSFSQRPPSTGPARTGFTTHRYQPSIDISPAIAHTVSATPPKRAVSGSAVIPVPTVDIHQPDVSASAGELQGHQVTKNSVISQPVLTPVTASTPVTDTLTLHDAIVAQRRQTGHRAITWSVALAPQTAYLPSGHSSLSMGGGVIADITLNGRFWLSTGLSVAQQTVGLSQPIYQVTTTTSGPVRQRTATDARLVFIDLPLNLTYQVGKPTRPLFRVSAGLSSLALVSQRYTDTYLTTQTQVVPVIDFNGQPGSVVQTSLTNQVEVRSGSGFGGVYWGRLLNLSVGIERPLSRRMVVAVEPYLKYPLAPLTQENLKIGSAGVSLRVGIR